jgi:hypothetical protein
VHDARHLGVVQLGNPTNCCERIEGGIVGQAVIHVLAVAAICSQSRAQHLLKVLRSICNGKPGLFREQLDAAFALRKLLEQLKAMGMAQCLRHRSELRKYGLLRTSP